MADRIAVMSDGELQQFGTAEAIYEHPANLFVADFVGEPPMNLLPCEPVRDNGHLMLRAAPMAITPSRLRRRLDESRQDRASSCLAYAQSTSISPGHRRPRLLAQARSVSSRIWATSRSSPCAWATSPLESVVDASVPAQSRRSGLAAGAARTGACLRPGIGTVAWRRERNVVRRPRSGNGDGNPAGTEQALRKTRGGGRLGPDRRRRRILRPARPSGAGKTTTLGLIAGLEPPDAGEIFLGRGRHTKSIRWKRDVAMAFESYALYPHMSVFDNIAFPLRAPTRSPRLSEQEIKSQVHRIAAMLQIDMLLDRSPSQLSGGQRQRTSPGADARAPAARIPDGRADRPPRRQAPPPHAGRAEAAPRAVCDDHLYATPTGSKPWPWAIASPSSTMGGSCRSGRQTRSTTGPSIASSPTSSANRR